MTEIKMSKRTALRLLYLEPRKVILRNGKDVFETAKGVIVSHEGTQLVFIPELAEYVDVKHIDTIFFTDRFGTETSMRVDWEGDDKND